MRQEVPEVFAAAHDLLLRLIAEGAVTGLRIDHPDGLWDPAGYFRDLQRAAWLRVEQSSSRAVEKQTTPISSSTPRRLDSSTGTRSIRRWRTRGRAGG